MYDIEKHQLLCDRIRDLCGDELAEGIADAEQREVLVSEAAKEFHGAAKISWDEYDRKSVKIDEPPLRARVLELIEAGVGVESAPAGE